MNKRNIFIIGLVVFSMNLWGQGSDDLGFNYQAVVRGTDGFVLPNQSVELRFSLMPGQSASQASWEETHTVTTDNVGTIGVVIGKGTKTGGIAATFADVNFAAAYYWLKVEIKDGGGTYRELSYSALTSVPYAKVAANAVAMPAGTIVSYGGETIPDGWLLCDGSEVSRSQYANLYAAIGTAWGYGDNAATFNLPDMRGVFLRGVTGVSGDDADTTTRVPRQDGGNSGNKVGSYQDDAIRNITGSISSNGTYGTAIFGGNPSTSGAIERSTTHNWNNAGNNVGGTLYSGFTFNASRVVPVGNDNRPKNVYVYYIIKY